MDPILVLLMALAGVAVVLLYLRFFAPPLHRVLRFLRTLGTRRQRDDEEPPSP